MSHLRSFIKFTRPHTVVGTSLSVVGLYLVAWSYDRPAEPLLGVLLLSLLACLGANIYIVGLNQLTDVEIDRINKPDLPLASGAFSLRTGRLIVGVGLVVALLLALLVGRYLLLTVAVSLLIGTAYSLPPLRLKRFHFWAAASIFTVRGVVVNLLLFLNFHFVFSGQANVPVHVWVLTAFVFGLSLVIAWFKDIPDVEGDGRFQIATLTLRLGAGRVFGLGLLLLSLCYVGMIAAGLLGLPYVNTTVLVVTHVLLLVALLLMSRRIEAQDRTAVARFYLFVWGLFFAEYIAFPLAALLG